MNSLTLNYLLLITTIGLLESSATAYQTKMTDALTPFVDHQVISGAVTLVANKTEILDLETVGYADLESRKPMAHDTLFWIASMTKPMTATALMMLVEEGKVDVNDPVEKYLPEFKGQMVLVEKDEDHALLKKPSHPILIREILSHTSGLLKRCPMDLPKANQLPLGHLVRTYTLSPLESDPGTNYDYSNPGLNTVGRIIEVVSGMPYELFMAQRIFKPLGMKDTTFFPTEEQLSRLATSYRVTSKPRGLESTDIGPLTYPLTNPLRHALPAGGLFSTAADLSKFGQMILTGETIDGHPVLNEKMIHIMTSKQTPPVVPNSYGFGWSVGLGNDRKAFGHGGAYRTYFYIDPKAELIGVFLTQREGAWITDEDKKVWPTFTRVLYDIGGMALSDNSLEIEGAP